MSKFRRVVSVRNDRFDAGDKIKYFFRTDAGEEPEIVHFRDIPRDSTRQLSTVPVTTFRVYEESGLVGAPRPSIPCLEFEATKLGDLTVPISHVVNAIGEQPNRDIVAYWINHGFRVRRYDVDADAWSDWFAEA